MRELLNYLPQRLSMCWDILTKSSVFLVTTSDYEKLQSIELRTINITNRDTITITETLNEIAINERNHFENVDRIFNQLISQ